MTSVIADLKILSGMNVVQYDIPLSFYIGSKLTELHLHACNSYHQSPVHVPMYNIYKILFIAYIKICFVNSCDSPRKTYTRLTLFYQIGIIFNSILHVPRKWYKLLKQTVCN